MLKKILIASILIFLIASFSSSIGAVNNPFGYYQITGGDIPASLNFPKVITMEISLPNLAVLKTLTTPGTYLVFDYYDSSGIPTIISGGSPVATNYGPFGIYNPDLPSKIASYIPSGLPDLVWISDWKMQGSKFVIEDKTTGEEASLQTLIDNEISKLNLHHVDVTVSNYSFMGSLNSKHSLNISLAVKAGVAATEGNIPNGTIAINGLFTTGPQQTEPPWGTGITPQNGKANLSNDLAKWVVHIIKKLPVKYLVPAN